MIDRFFLNIDTLIQETRNLWFYPQIPDYNTTEHLFFNFRSQCLMFRCPHTFGYAVLFCHSYFLFFLQAWHYCLCNLLIIWNIISKPNYVRTVVLCNVYISQKTHMETKTSYILCWNAVINLFFFTLHEWINQ